MKIGIGSLQFSRPIHAALTIAYGLCYKHFESDWHAFYGVHRYDVPKSLALDKMLITLFKAGHIGLHYLLPNAPVTCGANVDNLMWKLSGALHYDYLVKTDDDVLQGPEIDAVMCGLIKKLEIAADVHLLMGQAVRAHMAHPKPFAWEVELDGYRVVQRAGYASPMETYTAFTPRFMKILREGKKPTTCSDKKGTYGPYTRFLTEAGGKACLVLSPAIKLQHIGLTSLIERGAVRQWAPATDWDNDAVIAIDYFDFNKWYESHKDGTQKYYALTVIGDLVKVFPAWGLALDIIRKHLEAYQPGEGDVPLPSDPANSKPAVVLQRDGTRIRQKDGMVIRPPTMTVRRVKKIRVVPAATGERRR